MTVSEELGRGDRLCVNGGCGPSALPRVGRGFPYLGVHECR